MAGSLWSGTPWWQTCPLWPGSHTPASEPSGSDELVVWEEGSIKTKIAFCSSTPIYYLRLTVNQWNSITHFYCTNVIWVNMPYSWWTDKRGVKLISSQFTYKGLCLHQCVAYPERKHHAPSWLQHLELHRLRPRPPSMSGAPSSEPGQNNSYIKHGPLWTKSCHNLVMYDEVTNAYNSASENTVR